MAKNIKKKKQNGKVLKIISTTLLGTVFAGALGFTTYWTVKNWDKVNNGLNGANLYTEEDLKNAKQDGYEEALANKQEYENLLNDFKDRLQKSNDRIYLLESQIEKSNLDYQAKIEELQNTIDTNSEEYQQRVEALNSEHAQEIETLQSQLDSEKNNNSDLSSQIESLNAQILDLQQKISAYEEIIRQYENDQTAPVSFYDGENLIKATLVSKGSTYSLDESLIPSNTEEREFVGWAVDGIEVDADNYEITTATVFNAVFKYKVNYVINGETTSLMIKQGTTLSENAPEVTPGVNQEFDCWVDESGQAIDLETQITEPITITAEFNTVYTLTFNYNEQTSTVRVINGVIDGNVPKAILDDNHINVGWISEETGFISNSDLAKTTQDLILSTPKFIQKRFIKIKYRVGTGSFVEYSEYGYCAYLLDKNGDVSEYFVVSPSPKIYDMVVDIANSLGKENPRTYKCLSLVESATPYLYANHFESSLVSAGSSLDDVYIYLTLS